MACEMEIVTVPTLREGIMDTDAILRCKTHGHLTRINGVNYDIPRERWDCPHPVTMRCFSEVWEEHLAVRGEHTESESLPTHLL